MRLMEWLEYSFLVFLTSCAVQSGPQFEVVTDKATFSQSSNGTLTVEYKYPECTLENGKEKSVRISSNSGSKDGGLVNATAGFLGFFLKTLLN